MLDLNETTDHFAMANSVCLYGDVLRVEDSHTMKIVLEFDLKVVERNGS